MYHVCVPFYPWIIVCSMHVYRIWQVQQWQTPQKYIAKTPDINNSKALSAMAFPIQAPQLALPMTTRSCASASRISGSSSVASFAAGVSLGRGAGDAGDAVVTASCAASCSASAAARAEAAATVTGAAGCGAGVGAASESSEPLESLDSSTSSGRGGGMAVFLNSCRGPSHERHHGEGDEVKLGNQYLLQPLNMFNIYIYSILYIYIYM